MSTTFEVYPADAQAPRVADVVALAHRRLSEFTALYQLGAVPPIRFALHDAKERITPVSPASPMLWPSDSYMWFTFEGVAGGTDAYCRVLDEDDCASWEDEIQKRAPAKFLAPLIRQCVANRRMWWFRRSAGQPAIVNLGYGYLAASLAELTGGVIHSYDGAGHYDNLPCTSAEFYAAYFRPEQTPADDLKAWFADNLDSLREGMRS